MPVEKFQKMLIQIFTVPIYDTVASTEELNRFLRSNKILEVQNQFVNNPNGPCWCFCVKYIENGNMAVQPKEKTDYKQVLDDNTFKRFSKLREIRKLVALEESIPAFTIFTDEELAGLAKLSELTVSKMLTVKGIGEKKTEKYGQKFIGSFNQSLMDEKSGLLD